MDLFLLLITLQIAIWGENMILIIFELILVILKLSINIINLVIIIKKNKK